MFKFIESEELEKNVSEQYINKIEKQLNIEFPSILRKYYLNYNCAKEKECTFIIEGIDDYFILDTIIPLKYGTIPLEKEYKWVLENEDISNDMIPLAVDMDGDNYYWHKENGNVFYISHENVENPILICNSVEEFFEILNKAVEKDLTIPNLNFKLKKSKEKNLVINKKLRDMFIYIAFILITITIIVLAIKYN